MCLKILVVFACNSVGGSLSFCLKLGSAEQVLPLPGHLVVPLKGLLKMVLFIRTIGMVLYQKRRCQLCLSVEREHGEDWGIEDLGFRALR